MSDLSRNYLEFFKENSSDPIFSQFKGEDKIFINHLCDEADNERKAYGIRSFNKIFEQKIGQDKLMGRVLSMVYHLQDGIDNGFDPKGLGKYEHASTDYPNIYNIILKGISEKALVEMSEHKMDFATHFYPENLGEKVVERIIKDRAKIIGLPKLELKNQSLQVA
jgi:hypothetical protein